MEHSEWVLVPKDAIERAIETLENDGDEHGEGRSLRAMLDAAPQPPAEAQAQGGGEAVAWDNGSPCVESRPIGMVYPVKPAPRASGYLDTSGVEWSAYDTGQMEAYARAAYSDGWNACLDALSQQPAPSAPVGVEGFVVRHYTGTEGPTIKGNGFDGLRIGEDRNEAEEFIHWVNAALAQQPAAVDGGWRKKAAEWLESMAVEQEAANQRWPKHAACYKEWRDRPGILRHLAFQVLAAQQGGAK